MFSGGALHSQRDHKNQTAHRQRDDAHGVVTRGELRSLRSNIAQKSGFGQHVHSVLCEGLDLSCQSKIIALVSNGGGVGTVVVPLMVSDHESAADVQVCDSGPRYVYRSQGIGDEDSSIRYLNAGSQVEQPHGNRKEDSEGNDTPLQFGVFYKEAADSGHGENSPNDVCEDTTEQWSKDFCRTHDFIVTARSTIKARDALYRAAVCGRK